MQLSNKEQELLTTYQTWLRNNKLNDKSSAYFLKENLVLQVWDSQQNHICESVWHKVDQDKWEYCNKSTNTTFNIDYSLTEIFQRQKEFVLKTFKEKQNL